MVETITIKRKQLPVGQGGFHYCEFSLDDELKFNYIYDCDTNNCKKILEKQINDIKENLPENYRSVDLLFLSHFDKDNINGVKSLLNKGITVKKLVIPYINEDIEFLLRLNTFLFSPDDNNDEDFSRFLDSPDNWFNDNFGENNVIKVSDTEDNEEESYFDISLVNPSINDLPTEITHKRCLRIKIDENPFWILFPYVQPCEKGKLEKLKEELTKKFELSSAEDLLREHNLSIIFGNNRSLADLTQIYNKCNLEKPNSNVVIMSLYSGPSSILNYFYWYFSLCKEKNTNYSDITSSSYNDKPFIGWLGISAFNFNEPNSEKLVNHYKDSSNFDYLKDLISFNIPLHVNKNYSNINIFQKKHNITHKLNYIIPYESSNRHELPPFRSKNASVYYVTREESTIFEENIIIFLNNIPEEMKKKRIEEFIKKVDREKQIRKIIINLYVGP